MSSLHRWIGGALAALTMLAFASAAGAAKLASFGLTVTGGSGQPYQIVQGSSTLTATITNSASGNSSFNSFVITAPADGSVVIDGASNVTCNGSVTYTSKTVTVTNIATPMNTGLSCSVTITVHAKDQPDFCESSSSGPWTAAVWSGSSLTGSLFTTSGAPVTAFSTTCSMSITTPQDMLSGGLLLDGTAAHNPVTVTLTPGALFVGKTVTLTPSDGLTFAEGATSETGTATNSGGSATATFSGLRGYVSGEIDATLTASVSDYKVSQATTGSFRVYVPTINFVVGHLPKDIPYVNTGAWPLNDPDLVKVQVSPQKLIKSVSLAVDSGASLYVGGTKTNPTQLIDSSGVATFVSSLAASGTAGTYTLSATATDLSGNEISRLLATASFNIISGEMSFSTQPANALSGGWLGSADHPVAVRISPSNYAAFFVGKTVTLSVSPAPPDGSGATLTNNVSQPVAADGTAAFYNGSTTPPTALTASGNSYPDSATVVPYSLTATITGASGGPTATSDPFKLTSNSGAPLTCASGNSGTWTFGSPGPLLSVTGTRFDNKDGSLCIAVNYNVTLAIKDNVSYVQFTWDQLSQPHASFQADTVWPVELVNPATGLPDARTTKVAWVVNDSTWDYHSAVACLSSTPPTIPGYGRLNAPVDDTTVTSIEVDPNVTGALTLPTYMEPFPIMIGTERMLVTKIVDSSKYSGGKTLTVARGAGGTTPSVHSLPAYVMNTPLPLADGTQIPVCLLGQSFASVAPTAKSCIDAILVAESSGSSVSDPAQQCTQVTSHFFMLGDPMLSR